MINDFFLHKYIVVKQFVAAAQSSLPQPTGDDFNLPNVQANDQLASKLFGIVFGVAGSIAVLIIIVASLNMAKSDGNPEEISKAKKAIIYSIVGLLITISAEAIVYFVMERL